MTNLTILQSTSSVESVSALLIDKLYRLALTSKVEDPSNTLTMSLLGNISATAAYEDAVVYLRAKFPNLTVTIPDNNYYIRFEDPEVERLCVQKWGDGVGLSKSTAALITTIPAEMFRNNTTIQTFNELRYFSQSVEIGNYAFSGCTNLSSIDLSNVISIGDESFGECRALTVVNAPKLLTISNRRSFYNCTSLQKVESLGTIARFPGRPGYGWDMFNGCNAITEINLPQTLTYIDDVVSSSLNLSKITGLENVINAANIILNCKLQLILNLKNMTTCAVITNNCIINKVNAQKLKCSIDSTYYNNGYYNYSLFNSKAGSTSTINLVYLKNFGPIYGPAINALTCSALVFDCTTPYQVLPRQDGNTSDQASVNKMFAGGTVTIYVPNPDVWKADSFWSTYSDMIRDMADLPRVATEADLQQGQVALIEEYM